MEEILLFLSLLTPLGISMTRAGLGPRKTFVLALLRPFLQLTIGTLAFWLLGSGFVSQGNAFIGYENFLFLKTESDSLFQVRRFIIKQNIFLTFRDSYDCTSFKIASKMRANPRVVPVTLSKTLVFRVVRVNLALASTSWM